MTTAQIAGRIAGTVFAHTRHVARQIDWQEVAQIVWHGLITIAVMTYLAGEFTGRTLHRLNDTLSRVWVALWVPAPAPAAPRVLTPAPHPLMAVALELEQLTCKQLRQVLGTKRRCSKRELIGMAIAC